MFFFQTGSRPRKKHPPTNQTPSKIMPRLPRHLPVSLMSAVVDHFFNKTAIDLKKSSDHSVFSIDAWPFDLWIHPNKTPIRTKYDSAAEINPNPIVLILVGSSLESSCHGLDHKFHSNEGSRQWWSPDHDKPHMTTNHEASKNFSFIPYKVGPEPIGQSL